MTTQRWAVSGPLCKLSRELLPATGRRLPLSHGATRANLVCFNSTRNCSAKEGALGALASNSWHSFLLPCNGPPALLQAEFPLSHECLQRQQHEELKQWGSEASAPERSSGRQAHTKTETQLSSISSVSTTTKKPPLRKNPVFPFIHSFYIHHCYIISHPVLHHPYGNPSSWYLLWCCTAIPGTDKSHAAVLKHCNGSRKEIKYVDY